MEGTDHHSPVNEVFESSVGLWSVEEEVFRDLTLEKEFKTGLLERSAAGKENSPLTTYESDINMTTD